MSEKAKQKDIDYICSGFEASYHTAIKNGQTAKQILEKLGNPQLAASTAILSLEEVGKMCLIDGLLFSREGDERYKHFKDGFKSHKMKLDAVECFPLFAAYIAQLDPRFSDDPAFSQATVIILNRLNGFRNRLNEVFIPSFALKDLDLIKQKGFYADEVSSNEFRSTDNLMTEEQARAVVDFAYNIIDLLRFLLKDNLERYRNRMQKLREKVDDKLLFYIRSEVERTFEEEISKKKQ